MAMSPHYCPECLKEATTYQDEVYVFGLGWRKEWFTERCDVQASENRREVLTKWFERKRQESKRKPSPLLKLGKELMELARMAA